MADLLDASLDLVATLELEPLQGKLLGAMSDAAGAAGAALWLPGDERGELVLSAVAGRARREALPARIGPPRPEPASARTGDLLLPLAARGGEAVGAVLLQPARDAFAPQDRAAAAALARAATVALRNALRLRDAERHALRDRDTGAYRLGVFLDYAGKEFYKSRRYDRSFSLAVVTLERPDALRRAASGAVVLAASRGVVAALSRAAREADVVARVADGEYYVLLPETDAFGALMFQRRAADEIRREAAVRALDEWCPVEFTLGAATFPADGESFDDLLAACRARQREQRASLVRALRSRGAPVDDPQAFWPVVDLLLHDGDALPPGPASARLPLDPSLVEAVQREAARELGRDPRARAALYVSLCPGAAQAPAAAALPTLEASGRVGDTGSRMYVLGPRSAARGAPELDHPLVTRVFADGDERFATHAFVLFLSSGAAYALVQGPRGLFHTADAPLVEALVRKLQALHDVPPL